jgi:hypothetical protein
LQIISNSILLDSLCARCSRFRRKQLPAICCQPLLQPHKRELQAAGEGACTQHAEPLQVAASERWQRRQPCPGHLPPPPPRKCCLGAAPWTRCSPAGRRSCPSLHPQ